MEPAPFFTDNADAPNGASAFWVNASDDLRLRIALLGPAPEHAKGTVLLFSGRTEHVEKYGPAARDLRDRGYACISCDWRGQGLADRMLDNPMTGHVGRFSDYQHDVAAMLAMARTLDLPAPYFLIAHSMGGAIGLAALHNGLPVRACAFTGPMWGIALSPGLRPVAPLVAAGGRAIGLGHSFVPTTGPRSYILETPFAENALTTDRDMYAWMRRHLVDHPEFCLGGPSLNWFDTALAELRRLRGLPPPDLPCLTWVGSRESIVDVGDIRRLMACWPAGTLYEVPGAQHELMMEQPAIRAGFFDAATQLFDSSR